MPAATASGLFTPFRAIGYVTADVPLSVQARGQAHFITSSIGHSFQIFDGDKLKLLFVGPRLELPITSLASYKDLTFAASGQEVIVFERAREIFRFTQTDAIDSDMDDDDMDTHSDRGVRSNAKDIVSISMLGNIVFGVCMDNVVRMWDVNTRAYHNEIAFGPNFTVTCLVHPSTYLNKVLFASQQGTMQLWNIRSMKLIYEFKSFGSPISTVAQSPSIDVVAIGLLDGTVILYNIKVDKELMRFSQDGKVTAIAFRSDSQPVMATASMHGDIALWDLSERRLVYVMKGAHDAAVHTCLFFNNSPVMVTAASDNSIKQWAFDSLDGCPRLLRLRSGHHRPPTLVRHYDASGYRLLSSGQDHSLRMFCVIRDEQNCELSQGSLEHRAKKSSVSIDALKLPQMVQFAANPVKEQDWDNVLSCHSGSVTARSWSFQRKAIGKHMFVSPDGSPIKAVAVSPCGNFGYTGTSQGRIDKYNMQSGLHRTSFTGGDQGHTKAITAIAPDGVNRILVTSSLDKTVKFWDIATGALLDTIAFDTAVSHMVLHHDNGLLVIANDDMCVRVIDVDTKRIVREFRGHRNRITDITVSVDGRWVVSSSLDSTIRTWDVPTGYLIDGLRVPDIPTSVSMSPTGDFLVSAHVGHVGLFLWTNRSQYENVPVRRLDSEDLFETVTTLLTYSGNSNDDQMDDTAESATEADDATSTLQTAKTDAFQTPQDLVDGMISLSSLPKSRWQNLLNLEAIKKRNKPIAPPKAPEKAPFFLPVLAGAQPKFDMDAGQTDASDTNSSHILKNVVMQGNALSRCLDEYSETGNHACVMDLFKSMSPSATDLVIRTLPIDAEQTHLCLFLRCMADLFETHRDFELVQTYLNVFLKAHGDVLQSGTDGTRDALARVRQQAEAVWTRLDERLQYALCVIDFARGAPL